MADDRLIGRSAELAAVRLELERARAGRQRIVFIEGEPGIGKSALLAAVVAEAGANGFAVHSGRAEELERDRPFRALVTALGADAFPAASSASPSRALMDFSPSPSDRHRTVDALIDQIADEAEQRPVLLVLDDLQWADASTILTVHQLAERIPRARLLVLLALRPIPRGPELRRLFDALPTDALTRIHLRCPRPSLRGDAD